MWFPNYLLPLDPREGIDANHSENVLFNSVFSSTQGPAEDAKLRSLLRSVYPAASGAGRAAAAIARASPKANRQTITRSGDLTLACARVSLHCCMTGRSAAAAEWAARCESLNDTLSNDDVALEVRAAILDTIGYVHYLSLIHI